MHIFHWQTHTKEHLFTVILWGLRKEGIKARLHFRHAFKAENLKLWHKSVLLIIPISQTHCRPQIQSPQASPHCFICNDKLHIQAFVHLIACLYAILDWLSTERPKREGHFCVLWTWCADFEWKWQCPWSQRSSLRSDIMETTLLNHRNAPEGQHTSVCLMLHGSHAQNSLMHTHLHFYVCHCV